MSTAVAVVGMACRYPDARSPAELWENVLAQRRAFRPLPPERLRLADYAAGGGRAPPPPTPPPPASRPPPGARTASAGASPPRGRTRR